MSTTETSNKQHERWNRFRQTIWFSLLEFFGSLKLAMILLATLIVACIVGTVTESRFDANVARGYIYDAPWFIAWLTLLCINLTSVVVVRYPWKPHLTGFIITHAGIVTLLIGAIIGRIWGVEGMVTLFKGGDPATYLVVDETLLEVRTADMEQSEFYSVPINVRPPTPDRPFVVEKDGVKISVRQYAEELGTRMVVEQGGDQGRPAVKIAMKSAMVPEPIEKWLALGDASGSRVDLGPAVIEMVEKLAPAPGAGGKGGKKKKQAAADKPVASKELHFAFARAPEMTVSRPVAGVSTGVKAVYDFDEVDTGKKGKLRLLLGDKRFEFPVDGLMTGQTSLPGTPWRVKVLEYFADFRMKGKEPVSVSNDPNNPAILFEITGEAPPGTLAIPAHAEAAPPHGIVPAGMPARNVLQIARQGPGKFRYRAVSGKSGASEGTAETGVDFMPGWADWRFRIIDEMEHASLRQELVPVTEGGTVPTGAAGLQVTVESDGVSQTQWIPMGSPAHFHVGGESVHAGFGRRLHPLDFGVFLEDFEVERDEGTQNPAGFKSYVRFVDPKNKVAMKREIWMNHPANFPDYPGVGLLGTAYKFSQASWNPDDLNQTTLQVLRDPGWSLKWIGSLMICGGIFTMFYLKPYFRRGRSD